MKNSLKILPLIRISAIVLMTLLTTVSWAQDKGIDINVDLDRKDNWYQNPIVYVIGGAVFILLLVALLRGNKSSS